jgi:hypothetical protein
MTQDPGNDRRRATESRNIAWDFHFGFRYSGRGKADFE